MISPQRRREIIDALRRGTVPERGLDALAVGLENLAPTFDDELDVVQRGGSGFKAIPGRVRVRQDVHQPLADRARAPARVRHE